MLRLPHWCITNKYPALYDTESATAIEQTARVYKAMNELIDEYNAFVDNINGEIEAFENGTIENFDVFKVAIRQEFEDFINVVELKLIGQDEDIDAFKKSVSTTVNNIIAEKIKELDAGDMAQAVYDPQGKRKDIFSSFVNPNMLDNWYFITPVNQRNATSFTNVTYAIDRWIGTGVDILSGGLKPNIVGGWIAQRLEETLKNSLLGKTVTASVVHNGNLICGSLPYELGVQKYFTANDSIQLVLNEDGTFMIWCASPNITIEAVKLEIGDVQTLAHKEGDAWVLNEIPIYADQLARCQRYFYNPLFGSENPAQSFFGSGLTRSEGVTDINIPLPVVMRGTPSVLFNKLNLFDGTNAPVVNGISALTENDAQNANLSLRVSYDGTSLEIGKCVELFALDVDSTFTLSADL